MACTSQSMISASSCAFPSYKVPRKLLKTKGNNNLFSIRASSSSEESDCNKEECAPDKEVGKVSMEWLVGERTKVVGTFPPRPRTKGWTGYVEKDTAGQTNIYSVEPSVYVAESAISSGSAGTSTEGAENTAAIAAGVALISIAAASAILIQVSKNPPQMQISEYSGPSLSYYINKFKPSEIVEASLPESENSPTVSAESVAPGVSEIEVESNVVVSLGSELSNSS
ncbi:proline-rich family protein [Tasmannia lanceolata]|uniref:proline-rich family protein n=1 Tax=Tasmannia lanceolata TaxID=3420 RepID=UPI004062BAF5